MAELPESLKKYLPGPLLAVMTIVWWAGSDQIKDFIQEKFRHTPARIRIEDKHDNLHQIHIEITEYSPKDFEEVAVEIQLRFKPDDIKGEFAARDGTHSALAIAAKNPQSTAYYLAQIVGTARPLTLHQGDSLEISLHEQPAIPVVVVRLYSKDRVPIVSTDLNQRWPLTEIGWRILLAILGVLAGYYLYKLLAPLIFRKAQKQFEEDKEFLRDCWNADAGALTRFQAELQPLIDAMTNKYLKAFNRVTREQLRQTVIPLEIAKRAESLPRFRRPLASQVQKFVIRFCVDMLEEEYKQIKQEATRELAHIR